MSSALPTLGPRLAVTLACLTAVAGCTRHLNVSAMEPQISEGITRQVGLTIASVSCPTEPRPVAVDDRFDCTAEVQGGGRLTVTVTQTDDSGGVSWKVSRTDGLLDLAKVEASIVSGLKEQAQVDVQATCGVRYRPTKRGEAFDCQATAPDGTPIPIVVSVTDDEGNVSWATK